MVLTITELAKKWKLSLDSNKEGLLKDKDLIDQNLLNTQYGVPSYQVLFMKAESARDRV